jgi:hypothetical protein
MSFSSLGQSIAGISRTIALAWPTANGGPDRGSGVEQLPLHPQPEDLIGIVCSDVGDVMKESPCLTTFKTL